MPELEDRERALRSLLDAAAAARERGDWPSAAAIAEAAAGLDPDDPVVVDAMALVGARRMPSDPGERRRLTVMFCDLVGSTEIASALDPEDTRELLNAYYETCAEIVRRHDGHIAQLMGDGVLIYFGYPRAHEDDGVRAVSTALGIIGAVTQLHRVDAPDLEVRIGIHTGLSVISDIAVGAWTRQANVVGETPNLAARIQAMAPTGTVVISADTLGIVRNRVDVEPLGAHPVKGIKRPVELFRVVSMRASDDEGGVDGSRMITVGRRSERALLAQAWEDASQRGGYVVIAGEPGIGKSHLVRYARGLVGEGGRSLVLRSSALHSNTPLYPVAQSILPPSPRRVGDVDAQLDRLARAAEAVGLQSKENLYLLALMCSIPWPAARAIPDLQPEQARERTLALLCTWIDTLASRGRLLLVVEDLHWADPSTLDLLRRYITEPRPDPVLVLATTRLAPDTAPGEPTMVITLEPLRAAESNELIDRLTRGRLDQATRMMVAERGDGVPVYLRELATMLDPATRGGSDSPKPLVPPTLNDLLVARLDSFPDEREVVGALAVLGRPCPPELVARVTDRPAAEVQQQLGLLERAGILRCPPGQPQYDFHHTLLRDAAYDMQLLAHRREIHRRAAEALQALFPASHDNLQELAHHYQLAGELEPAVTLWMRSALQEASVAAHAEAIQSFELVLGHLPQLGEDRAHLELRAQSGLAASMLASRGYTAREVAAAYGKLRELAAAQDAELEFSGLYGLWAYYHVTGDAATSLETAESLLDRALGWDDPHAERAARAVLGYQLQRVGRPTEAVALLEQGRRWDSPHPLLPHHPGIGAGANLAITQWLLGEFTAARESIKRAVASAETLDGPTAHFTRAYTHAFAAEFFHIAGEPASAGTHAGRVVQISSEFGFASWLAAGMTHLKIAEALSGDLDAIPALEYCLTAWRDAGASSNLTQFGLGLALAYRAAGRFGEALTAIDRALTDASETQELYLEPELHRVRGELLTELAPDDERGSVELERALVTAQSAGSRALELSALLSLERCYRDHGSGPIKVHEIEGLLRQLDPTGQDPEALLAKARAVIVREPAR